MELNKQVVRVFLIVLVLGIAGQVLGYFAGIGDTVGYTVVLIVTTIAVAAIVKAFGPVQKESREKIERSKEAALIAVRISMVVGALGSIYANMLGASPTATAFATGMVVPAIIWFFVYWFSIWRNAT